MTTNTQPNWRDWDMDTWSITVDTDAYKVSMWKQYPPKTEYITSYIEARGGRFPNTLFFGLQAFLTKLERPIIALEVEFARAYWIAQNVPFNYDGWMYIVNELGGKLPIQIDAIEEGTLVPIRNALLRITNTDPNCAWLTTWVETSLLRAVWYPTTVATLSWTIKQLLIKYLEKTTDDAVIPTILPFRLHDFGARGASSYEAAKLGGMAHLVNFVGSDTGPASLGAMQWYDAVLDPDVEAIEGTGIMTSPSYSIPAAEHSTITSWGRDGEVDAYRNMINQFGGEGKIYAVVSDSYDVENATGEIWGTVLKDEVEAKGGTLVVRPDSGDPTIVPIDVVVSLGDKFGYAINTKGYKVLSSVVRVIQGDGIDYDTIETILENLVIGGWSVENMAFGMGGALLQKPNRDTMQWAMKASAIKFKGDPIWHGFAKDPVTDRSKKSKTGRQSLVTRCGVGSCGYTTLNSEFIRPEQDLLTTVFENGTITKRTTFEEVRVRSNNWDPSLISNTAAT